ncbi:hypothetical protein VFPPC_11503 [Pochonia chlamydosporia 170]|uniref:Uncharacterized protein n=1 Tax=Pochonia chlamydosporia 170 TaxID=1380566 RepID=A0A179F0N8_METCM|nr:hypothetical protein VFPPC_11503 [Pochonia chlamydosporia 170]OAQ59006.2 hypothetical protein VFPPC_11503 [Pochonia chlamydosporia 170]
MKPPTNFWKDYIFANEAWPEKILSIKNYDYHKPPSISALSPDLPQILKGNTKGTFVTLLLHDDTGDLPKPVYGLRKRFYQSLKPYSKEGQERYTVLLTESGITLHILDAIEPDYGHPYITLPDPKRLFELDEAGGLRTYIIDYSTNKMRTIKSRRICGMQGETAKQKRNVAEICCINLKIGPEGASKQRVFMSASRVTRVVRLEEKKKITGWKPIADDEQEELWLHYRRYSEKH